MGQKFKKALVMLLTVAMLVGTLPASAYAAFDYSHNGSESSDSYYKLIEKQDWTLAPGITESEIVLNNEAGNRRQVVHLMKADMNSEYTKVTTSYTNMDTKNYAVSNMMKQATWVEDNWGWNVVGAMNTCLSWYNTDAYAKDPSRVNEPLGFMMIDSEVYFDHSVGFPTVLVINKDTNENGEARPADIPKVEMVTINTEADLDGWEEQVIPCSSGYIVKDGKNLASKATHGNDDAPRSVVGITADGEVVIMMNDGRQSPYSAGMNMYECAEVMLDAGCTYAVNCDGGGSSTFLSQRPGETELAVNCKPSDGALRETTSGILFISTAPSTGEFDNAYIESDYDYYVPNSTVNLKATGLDFSGAVAEIPADITWTLSDDKFGEVKDGVFKSNGTTGAVDVQIEYEGEVVGAKTLNIVNPESVAFEHESTVLPYGKSTSLNIKVNYDVFEVGYSEDNFDWILSDADAGVRDGFTYTATTDESKSGVVISATYKYADLGTTELEIKFGKGSESIWNFEDGDISKWMGISKTRKWLLDNKVTDTPFSTNTNFSDDNESETFLASTSNGGQVKNGQYSLGVNLDYTHSSFSGWSYNMFFFVGEEGNVENGGGVVLRDVANGKNATKLGMWVYIPEGLMVGKDLKGIAMQYQFWAGESKETAKSFGGHLLTKDGKNLLQLTDADIPEDRWVYFTIDLSGHNYVSTLNPRTTNWREPCFIRFYTQHYTPKNMTFYFDDMTLDYSDAVDDRDVPAITNLSVNNVGNDRRSFNADVADYSAQNTSGLDYTSAKIYVDGVELKDVTAANGKMSSAEVNLLPGKHKVTFEIADNMGNRTKESEEFTIAGTDEIILTGHNDLGNAPEYGSIYYVDLKATNIENVETIVATLDLNTAHKWEYENATVAKGFDAEFSLNEYSNEVTVTLTRTGEGATGENTLVSIPTRIWTWDAEESGTTVEAAFASGLCPIVPYDVKVVRGEVTFVEGANDGKYDAYVGTFNGSFSVETNLNDNINPWHTHNAVAVEDKPATCEEKGYTDRTYCEGCGSFVDWGKVVDLIDHEWEFIDDKLTCKSGGEFFNGEYIDGKTYVDGVVKADGWDGESYYKDGLMLTGVQIIDGKYYNFGNDGICKNKYPMSNEWYTNDEGQTFFLNAGEPVKGYNFIHPDPAFFDQNGVAFDGEVVISGETCVFEKGRFVKSTTADVLLAGLAGPKAYFIHYADGTLVLSGEGETYDYVSVGTAFAPNIAWKNRPWGKTTGQLSQEIKKIVVGKDITTIGDLMFTNCWNLSEVEFEEGSSLKELGLEAFFQSKVKTVVLPNKLTTIAYGAFGYCNGLTNVYMPESLNVIHSQAFRNNNENLVLNVVEGSSAHKFAEKYSLKTEFREAEPYIIAEGDCGENATWTLSSEGNLVISGSGAMADYKATTAPWTAYRTTIKSITIGKDITAIGNYAFGWCQKATTVTFEEGSQLETIGRNAFHYMRSLKEIELPETVKTIGFSALGYGGVLEKVYLPGKISEINDSAFLESNAELVLSVEANSYAHKFATNKGYNTELRPEVIDIVANGECGENVQWTLDEYGNLVISGSGAMADYKATTAPWTAYRTTIKSITIGKDITAIGNYAFGWCQKATTVTFEEGSQLETIGRNAFHYMRSLKEIELPETVKTIGFSALGYGGILEKVYLPGKISEINDSAFLESNAELVLSVEANSYAHKFATNKGYNTELRPEVIDIVANGECGENVQWTLDEYGNLVISGSGAMADYKATTAPWTAYRTTIKSITIGKDITAIGNYAFGWCQKATTVTFEEGSQLETIGRNAFHYMRSLKEIELPETVKTIGFSALGYGGVLEKVYLPGKVSEINDSAFLESNAELVLSVEANSYAHKFAVSKNINYEIR